MSEPLDFGKDLNEVLREATPAGNMASWSREAGEAKAAYADFETGGESFKAPDLLQSAGPISDGYIFAANPVDVIVGPIGSGKSVASVKKALISAQRIYPTGAGGVRRYVLGVWQPTYDRLWKQAIRKWWSVFPKDLSRSRWSGAPPRAATHEIEIHDPFGVIQLTVMFLAFSDLSDPEDLRGYEFTDCHGPEIDLWPKELLMKLLGRVGRDPAAERIKRLGRIFGDMNAPSVTNHLYPLLYEKKLPGFILHNQPGGLSPDAENIKAVGRAYYEQLKMLLADQPVEIRRLVDNIPGPITGTNLVYPGYQDLRNRSATTLAVYRELPVLVGIDNELSPAAVYTQCTSDGQSRTLAEIALQGLPIEELGARMLELEAKRFVDCEFTDYCDPAMLAGEDAGAKSERQRLEGVLHRKIKEASTNEPSRRRSAVNDKIAGTRSTLADGRPAYIADPSCEGLRRGKMETYRFRKVQGTDELGSIAKTFDGHVADAEQYAYLAHGTDAARKRQTDIKVERARKRAAARDQGRYNPLARRTGGRR